jgi:hypothetical protein
VFAGVDLRKRPTFDGRPGRLIECALPVVEGVVRVMADLAFIALTVVFFAAVALIARRADRT